MLAYRHAFHAGNPGDVLKHVVLTAVLRHQAQKAKGLRFLDTHAGAGAYRLDDPLLRGRGEWPEGVGRLWERRDLPPAVADWLALVRRFNRPRAEATEAAAGADAPAPRLRRYPGSPAIAAMLLRPQDQLRLCELHPADHRRLNTAFRRRFFGGPPAEVHAADGFMSLKSNWPPPTRRGVLLIDPPYEVKADYARVLTAVREALARFAEGIVIVWVPQLALLDAARLPERLRASAAPIAPKGWLHAKLTTGRTDERGFGLVGSSVFVANPPHGLVEALREALPVLAAAMGREGAGRHTLEHDAR
jgi:23S rRNA (adenine2030-N6)-methyltransferase